ncbi:MAG: hypothetical protein IJT48_02680 [Bacteroidaceae bacterium]|nr:hypothetical protein [Bacteroidaceae bacterium]
MKRKSTICMLLLGLMLGMFSTSCQDMLSPNSERHSYTVAEDTLYSYWGILRSLQNIAERYVILNECRGDLVDETSYVSDSIGAIINFGETSDPEKYWKDGACAYLRISDYYHVINSCNAYIAMCDTTRTTGTSVSYMIKEYAQVQAIRAWVYMQLLYAYGENRVPFYTEPMLTTDNINSFLNDKNHKLLNAQVLADELGPKLEEVEHVEYDGTLGLPNYNNYGDVSSGNTHFVCHSSLCLFPVSIVLGDLYLLGGQYEKSALHYFNYISSNRCGPLDVGSYYSRGWLNISRQDYPAYEYVGVPYTQKTAVDREHEAITCIPSNKGKLEGKVLTDISRLFGFEATMRTSNDENAGASVGLTRNYERELIPSRGYEALCDSQKFEIYIVDGSMRPESIEELRHGDLRVGDARRSWIYASNVTGDEGITISGGMGGAPWTFRVGDDLMYGKMVAKQNPGGSFSPVYPMVYRKSTVWLRYAEALNRAHFPGYAFAILKSGLCDNPNYLTEDPTDPVSQPYKTITPLNKGNIYDYPLKSGHVLLCYQDPATGKRLPEGWDGSNAIRSETEFLQWYRTNLATEEELAMTDEALASSLLPNIYWMPDGASAFENKPNDDCTKACYHISLDERQRARNKEYLNMNKGVTGNSRYLMIYGKEQGTMPYPSDILTTEGGTGANEFYTIGVHQRGCGFLFAQDPISSQTGEIIRSSYNYVDQVAHKIKENTGRDVTADDIYSGNIDADVEDAVEDLIIDEMGLELAFEGTRFSDLYRAAQRRGEDYLASRVAKRHTGEIDSKLRSRLQDKSNWCLPIPTE